MSELAGRVAASIRRTEPGLDLPGGLTFERWQQIGERLGNQAQRSLWEIADWVNYGEDAYGRKYQGALEVTGLEKQTLMNMASVAERIYRRREQLSFGHHAEVAFLRDPETQLLLLDAAIAEGWSRNELREKAAAYRAKQKPQLERPVLTVWKVKLEPDIDELVRSEAEKVGVEPEAWIVEAIREKAERRLEVAA